jgi:hypothetical protein
MNRKLKRVRVIWHRALLSLLVDILVFFSALTSRGLFWFLLLGVVVFFL